MTKLSSQSGVLLVWTSHWLSLVTQPSYAWGAQARLAQQRLSVRARFQPKANRLDTLTQAITAALATAKERAYRHIPANKRLEQAYFSANRPVVDGQLSQAGLRLASTLNNLLRTP